MRPLPHWSLTNLRPAFYDTESGSAIQMVAKIYGAMNDLISEYNSFVDETNKAIKDFENDALKSNDEFKSCITSIVEKYIRSIDIMIDKQDLKIEQAITFMKENISNTTTEILTEAINAGKITVSEVYDPETESLNMVVSGEV